MYVSILTDMHCASAFASSCTCTYFGTRFLGFSVSPYTCTCV